MCGTVNHAPNLYRQFTSRYATLKLINLRSNIGTFFWR